MCWVIVQCNGGVWSNRWKHLYSPPAPARSDSRGETGGLSSRGFKLINCCVGVAPCHAAATPPHQPGVNEEYDTWNWDAKISTSVIDVLKDFEKWWVMGDDFVVHQAAVVAFYKEEAIGLHSSQHGPTWPTRLPWTGHTMRHPLPAHFYCHSPPGPHEDGEIPGGDGEIETPPGIHHPNTSTLGEERTARALFSRNLDWWTAVSCDKAELGQTCRTSPLSWLSFISCCCS